MKLLFIGIEASVAIATCGTAVVLADILPADRPALGRRGERRARALTESALLRLGEPLLRQVAAWVGRVMPGAWQRALDLRLAHAGHWFGLTADELGALALLGALASGGSLAFDLVSWPYAVLGTLGVGALPLLCLRSEEKARRAQMSRTLPAAIDLVALCMSAGVDFPGAVRFVVGEPGSRDIAREELGICLRALELGQTRAEAISGLLQRVPCDAVQGFVAAVVQAEEKGNPLSEVLQIQATVLRGQRSLAAEEAAARAGVLMVLPLLLLLACVLVLLLGPFLLTGGL